MNAPLSTVLLFPGQGAHKPEMLSYAAALPAWPEMRERTADLAGFDPAASVEREGEAALRRNEVSSLLTVAVSLTCLTALRERIDGFDAVAGYSVGQYAALHAAGMLSLDDTLKSVAERARLMNRTRAAADGRMTAVVGLKDDIVEAACRDVSTEAEPVAVANYNCPGQVTISATAAAMERVEPALRAHKPLRLIPLPVAGAWHCELLRPAVAPLARHLETVDFSPAALPIIDNVTGELFPADLAAIRDGLAEHLARPVRWRRGVAALIDRGARRFIEVGFGEMLTRFGFFIDRKRDFQRWDCVS